jgi:hypothetical protein
MAGNHDLQPEDLAELERDVRRLCGPPVEVPTDADAAIRWALRRSFAKTRRKRLVVARRLAPFAAAVAVVMLVLWLATLGPPSPPPPPFAARSEPADLDRNGRVDILDAFHLAQRLERGETVDSTLDLNRDGAVDARDVDRIALRAVSLTPGAG